MMSNIEFANKEYFWLFLVFIPMIFWYVWRLRKSAATMKISNLFNLKKSSLPWRYILRHFLFALRILVLSALIIVLARPQSIDKWEDRKMEGIDIIIAFDVSGSMLAEDFKPNRIEAAKEIGMEFVSSRPNDRMGLVVFAAESYTQCPLTIDHAVLLNLFSEIKDGIIEDGTAIGMGLANSVNRLKDSEAISKVIILLTDGVNNTGNISPLAAAEIAKEFGIRVYTIGVGKNGMAPYPFQTPFGIQYQNMEVKIDEEVLQKIAEQTGGKYFRATDNQKLRDIYKEIDSLEKTELEVRSYSKPREEFSLILIFAMLIFVLEQFLGLTILKNTF
ncbi:MAG: VWA domain-containing protein [Bacteroidales bacterium]|jgi:Ca-activated chloride channel family protein|nr:VWA domain-containing protein [Bacteroidales bacterium]MCK9498695.1 VWA domain-containing protein [Bacteroidales bacterium]